MGKKWLLLAALTMILASLACNLPGGDAPLPETSPPLAMSPPPPASPCLPGPPLCADPAPPLVTDFQVYPVPELPEPPPRVPFRDPLLGTCVVRVTDRTSDLAPDDSSSGLKNEYARVQSFNADGSLILVRSIDAFWYLYDADTLQPLGRLPLVSEPRWDGVDPDRIYYTDETRLFAYDVASGATEVVHDLAADLPGQGSVAVWTRYEGSPSVDTRYWGLMAENEDWLPVAFLVYDRQADRVTVRDVHGLPGIEEDVDHVTMSLLGNYFLASFDRYCEPGQLGSDAHPCGLMVYDRDLQNGRGLLRIVGHYDVALDAEGREVLVYQDIDSDHISLLDLESGAVTPLWPIDFSHTPIGFHFSGRAFRRPGWALVSTYSGGYPTPFTWMDDQVLAVELRAGGRVVRLAQTHSRVDEEQEHDYWAEPHASANADFTRVLFTSNWGRSGTEEVEMYMLELPADWSETLP